MAAPELTYFTCTLGQAAKWKQTNPRTFDTINHLLDEQAKYTPESLAVGFSHIKESTEDDPYPVKLNFSELRSFSFAAASTLSGRLSSLKFPQTQRVTVGLLSRSSPDFLGAWLGLLRLGLPVILLAPQLEPSAIKHLCTVSQVTTILTDRWNYTKATSVNGIQIISIDGLANLIGSAVPNTPMCRPSKPTDIAYFFHTSGTSSGLPKPIPQTHHAAVGVLPNLPHGNQFPTFSTTPLYHGGIADCFRAWSSGAMIWLFPEGLIPITARTIRSCIEVADTVGGPPVQYFTSVPYILQMLAEDSAALHLLSCMRLVGVGGAALPASVGDKLVSNQVNLVSRYGSAECGFLLSSHRDYSVDKEWQYLRTTEGFDSLSFEPHDDQLHELVVKSTWPCVGKVNRKDDSYATSDVFEPHPTAPDLWRYHGRADAQINLVNGKKFDPSPVEAAIVATISILQDILIFGNGREYPGAIFFPTKEAKSTMSPEDILETVWFTVNKLNEETQSHARISKSMLVMAHPSRNEATLPKSSKGSILRGQAEKIFAEEIERAYQSQALIGLPSTVPNDQLLLAIRGVYCQVSERDINPDDDVFYQGIDSLAASRIRTLVNNTFLSGSGVELGPNAVYDFCTVRALTERLKILRLQKNGPHRENIIDNTSLELMQELVTEYSDFTNVKVKTGIRRQSDQVIVLTGATGGLGAHILDLLRRSRNVQRVYCLVRAQMKEEARDRVVKSLKARGLPGLDDHRFAIDQDPVEVVCVQCRIAEARLGLPDGLWSSLLKHATTIIHSAWAVNFNINLRSFANHLRGTQSLAALAMEAGARFIFVSSTAAVLYGRSNPVHEKISSRPEDASPLGYSRSKWVAEGICARAFEHACNVRLDQTFSSNYGTQSSICIVRVGQLCGGAAGIWNMSEAYPLMLSTGRMLDCLPDLGEEAIDWLPVDQAAKAILEISAHVNEDYQALSAIETPVYHVLNYHKDVTWKHLLDWIRTFEEEEPGCSSHIEILPPQRWLDKLEENLSGDKTRHSATALIPLWRRRFGTSRTAVKVPSFDVETTSGISPSIHSVRPLTPAQVKTMWQWINQNTHQ
ncbi:uncharacterized protein E0L32_003923 [Thyridium curvatum]|uniref:Carrier domain-containing protein n=1 Tax=Thyridium curvatum TaxID=1093900 RepID=A0A507BC91_9PEZI|nr:uncharacterized protein E0L32_003923 [Thyridium curvatum]TPX16274.1 hypothetical protein E0L32_003923 [Thyridium curvatum]